MTFISDGTRTWDKERNLELKIITPGRRWYDFKLDGPEDFATFYGEYELRRISSLDDSEQVNPNRNTIIIWHLRIQIPFNQKYKDEIKKIIREALGSFEYYHGRDRAQGNPLMGTRCHFEGKYA